MPTEIKEDAIHLAENAGQTFVDVFDTLCIHCYGVAGILQDKAAACGDEMDADGLTVRADALIHDYDAARAAYDRWERLKAEARKPEV